MVVHVQKYPKFVHIKELDDKQFNIALAFLENQGFDNKGNQKGVAGYKLRDRISGATLGRYKEELLKCRVLYVVSTKKTGQQTRIFYGLTPFGYYLLLKKNHKKVMTPKYAQIFLPRIFDYWQILNRFPELKQRSIISTLNNIILYPNGPKEKHLKYRINIPTKDSTIHISYVLDIGEEGYGNRKDLLFGWYLLSNFEILFFIDMFFAFDPYKKMTKILEIVERSGYSKDTKKYMALVENMLKEYKKMGTDRTTFFKNDKNIKQLINSTIRFSNDSVKASFLDVPFKD